MLTLIFLLFAYFDKNGNDRGLYIASFLIATIELFIFHNWLIPQGV